MFIYLRGFLRLCALEEQAGLYWLVPYANLARIEWKKASQGESCSFAMFKVGLNPVSLKSQVKPFLHLGPGFGSQNEVRVDGVQLKNQYCALGGG